MIVCCFRNIRGNDEEVSNAIEMLKMNGFINYYGLQRFGSSVVSPTYLVGKSLACGNCEEVKISKTLLTRYFKNTVIIVYYKFILLSCL